MEYKKILFNIPVGWDINKCFVKIEDNKIIMDNPIDINTFDRCVSPLLDGDDYLIEELGADRLRAWKQNVLKLGDKS